MFGIRIMNKVFIGFLLLFCSGFAGGVYANDVLLKKHAVDAGYQLGPEDQLKIIVFGEDDLSGLYKLDGRGFISVPLIGELDLRGKTVREVEVLIERDLSDGYLIDPSVSIEVAKHRPFYILGEVRLPGQYDYVSNMNVFNAVAMAGGFTYRADQDTVKVMKHGEQDENNAEGRSVSAMVEPGDVIIVRERFF